MLFVTYPARTHFHHIVPVAWALRTAGHEVHVASGPELTDVITGAGLTAVAAGSDEPLREKVNRFSETANRTGFQIPDIGMAEDRPEMLTLEKLKRYHSGLAEILKVQNDSMIEDLVAYGRWWKPDLVVWEWLSNAGPVVAAAVGAVQARMSLIIEVDVRLRGHFLAALARQAPQDREDPVAEWVNGWGEKYGFAFSEEMFTGQFVIDQMVPSLQLESAVPHVPVRYIPYNGQATVPEWCRAEPEKPRVLATFGVSMWSVMGDQLISTNRLQDMLDSMADLDIELVLTLPERIEKRLRSIPGNTRIVPFVPLHAIVPSCSAVIHHGGIPGFSVSASHGVPQLMVSRAAPDADLRGGLLEKAQAGLWLAPEEMTGETLRDRLVRLLDDPAFRSGAGRLREEMLAQPTPNDAVAEIERLTDAQSRRKKER
ncbi:activator-dependent family glycosyltransferase [Streptomyces sparsogenes]|uniref:activator-dependent family glycosyltransferase n=1 Tax=Streptomyces sparsogenes TaxID=67365 RepID=UPI0034111231